MQSEDRRSFDAEIRADSAKGHKARAETTSGFRFVSWVMPTAWAIFVAMSGYFLFDSLGLWYLVESHRLPMRSAAAQQPEEESKEPARNCVDICGQVIWAGEMPTPATWRLFTAMNTSNRRPGTMELANPLLPTIHPKTRGMPGAIVFLRGASHSPNVRWKHPPVRVDVTKSRFEIKQGKEIVTVGIVRVGDEVAFENVDDVFHGVVGRGAANFSIPLPTPKAPVHVRFEKPGVVELRGAGGAYWQCARLVVFDHPQVTRTDEMGSWRLAEAPEGDFEVVAYWPNWNMASVDPDGDSLVPVRVRTHEGIEQRRSIQVRSPKTAFVSFQFQADMVSASTMNPTP